MEAIPPLIHNQPSASSGRRSYQEEVCTDPKLKRYGLRSYRAVSYNTDGSANYRKPVILMHGESRNDYDFPGIPKERAEELSWASMHKSREIPFQCCPQDPGERCMGNTPAMIGEDGTEIYYPYSPHGLGILELTPCQLAEFQENSEQDSTEQPSRRQPPTARPSTKRSTRKKGPTLEAKPRRGKSTKSSMAAHKARTQRSHQNFVSSAKKNAAAAKVRHLSPSNQRRLHAGYNTFRALDIAEPKHFRRMSKEYEPVLIRVDPNKPHSFESRIRTMVANTKDKQLPLKLQQRRAELLDDWKLAVQGALDAHNGVANRKVHAVQCKLDSLLGRNKKKFSNLELDAKNSLDELENKYREIREFFGSLEEKINFVDDIVRTLSLYTKDKAELSTLKQVRVLETIANQFVQNPDLSFKENTIKAASTLFSREILSFYIKNLGIPLVRHPAFVVGSIVAKHVDPLIEESIKDLTIDLEENQGHLFYARALDEQLEGACMAKLVSGFLLFPSNISKFLKGQNKNVITEAVDGFQEGATKMAQYVVGTLKTTFERVFGAIDSVPNMTPVLSHRLKTCYLSSLSGMPPGSNPLEIQLKKALEGSLVIPDRRKRPAPSEMASLFIQRARVPNSPWGQRPNKLPERVVPVPLRPASQFKRHQVEFRRALVDLIDRFPTDDMEKEQYYRECLAEATTFLRIYNNPRDAQQNAKFILGRVYEELEQYVD